MAQTEDLEKEIISAKTRCQESSMRLWMSPTNVVWGFFCEVKDYELKYKQERQDRCRSCLLKKINNRYQGITWLTSLLDSFDSAMLFEGSISATKYFPAGFFKVMNRILVFTLEPALIFLNFLILTNTSPLFKVLSTDK